jgi:hypothetical protein
MPKHKHGFNPSTQLAKFLIYPKGNWYHYRVFVWKTKSEMHKYLKAVHVIKIKNCEAICCCCRVLSAFNRVTYTTGCLGHIHFYADSFKMGIITHECAHAALNWCRVRKKNPMNTDGTLNASKDEEEFCWVLGNLARQVVLKADKQWRFDGYSAKTS